MQVMACQVPTQHPTWHHPNFSPGHSSKSVTAWLNHVFIYVLLIWLLACTWSLMMTWCSQNLALRLDVVSVDASEQTELAAMCCSSYCFSCRSGCGMFYGEQACLCNHGCIWSFLMAVHEAHVGTLVEPM